MVERACTKRAGLSSVALIGLLVTTCLPTDNAQALVIYRFGGQDLPPPAEADDPGVDFLQLPWTDFDPAAGAETVDLDLTPEAIGSLRRDPTL